LFLSGKTQTVFPCTKSRLWSKQSSYSDSFYTEICGLSREDGCIRTAQWGAL